MSLFPDLKFFPIPGNENIIFLNLINTIIISSASRPTPGPPQPSGTWGAGRGCGARRSETGNELGRIEFLQVASVQEGETVEVKFSLPSSCVGYFCRRRSCWRTSCRCR